MLTKTERVAADRLAQLRAFAPEVFVPGTLLYVGACPQRPPECLAALEAAGRKVTILEIWPENAAYYRKQGYEVICSDVRRISELELPQFDMTTWFHGPEHLEQADVPGVLAELERLSRVVVIAVPWGVYPQPAAYGNPYNEHRATFEPEDFSKLGYRVDTIGARGQQSFSNILAVKP